MDPETSGGVVPSTPYARTSVAYIWPLTKEPCRSKARTSVPWPFPSYSRSPVTGELAIFTFRSPPGLYPRRYRISGPVLGGTGSRSSLGVHRSREHPPSTSRFLLGPTFKRGSRKRRAKEECLGRSTHSKARFFLWTSSIRHTGATTPLIHRLAPKGRRRALLSGEGGRETMWAVQATWIIFTSLSPSPHWPSDDN